MSLSSEAAAHALATEIAWLNGAWISGDDLSIPVGDAGFVLGATVTEQLRTFGGRLFLADQHAARFRDSLACAGIDPGLPLEAIFAAAETVASHNHARGHRHDDLGVIVFATPGNLPSQHRGRSSQPRVAIHSFPLAFSTWSNAYRNGITLRSVSICQVPDACWPLQMKCRSRMHYVLADTMAKSLEPGARAVLCHADGRVSETSTANIAIVQRGMIITPPSTDALAGVSLHYLKQLSASLGIVWREHSLRSEDLASADEILLTSTPNCLLPATRLDGRPIGSGQPGPIAQQLLAAWSGSVGLDIVRQAFEAAEPNPPKALNMPTA